MDAAGYEPFAAGPFPVGVRTLFALDTARNRAFPCEIWYPAQTGGRGETRDAPPRVGTYPIVVFSHHSGGHRRTATFLCTHLAGHGYFVAALDHSEVVAKELSRRDGETSAERAARIEAVISSRVPDLRFLIDHLLGADGVVDGIDAARIGLVGHSFGGWTVLAAPEVDPRVRAVVAMAPGGSSKPRPGILPLNLTFDWGRDVPAMFLAGELDVPIPLAGIYELFDRTPSSKCIFVLRRADHQHFVDDVEVAHEAARTATFPAEAAWIPAAMRPMAELNSGEEAHLFVRGLTLAHLDATLRQLDPAERFLAGDVEAELAAHGLDAFAPRERTSRGH